MSLRYNERHLSITFIIGEIFLSLTYKVRQPVVTNIQGETSFYNLHTRPDIFLSLTYKGRHISVTCIQGETYFCHLHTKGDMFLSLKYKARHLSVTFIQGVTSFCHLNTRKYIFLSLTNIFFIYFNNVFYEVVNVIL